MAYPQGYWAELVRSNSSSVLTFRDDGFYIWLRTSDGEPLEQQILRSGASGGVWEDVADDTGEPDYLTVLNGSTWRFRKAGEDWIPSDNGVSLVASVFTDNFFRAYRFFEVPAAPVTTVAANAGNDKTVASGGKVTLGGAILVTNGVGATTYAWTRVSGAGGALSAANVAQPDFTAPVLAPGAADREIVWRITATNNGVSATDDVTVTVEAPPALAAPNFADDTGDAAAWTQGTAIAAITVPAATGNPAPVLSVVGNLPAGIAFNPANRQITGTPTAVGSGTIRIRATNSQGSDDWTVAYVTAASAEVGNQATFTIGDGGTGATLSWPILRNKSYGTIPAELMASGVAAQLRQLLVYSGGLVNLNIQPPDRIASAVPQSGHDLIQSVERFDPAIVIEAGGHKLELPGPDNPNNVFRDALEVYAFNVGNGHGQAAFIQAYRALTQAQRNATTLTITDEQLTQQHILRPSFAGTMVGSFAPELRHTEVPESIPLAPYFAGRMVGSFEPELRITEVAEHFIIRPEFRGTMRGSFEPALVFDAGFGLESFARPDGRSIVFAAHIAVGRSGQDLYYPTGSVGTLEDGDFDLTRSGSATIDRIRIQAGFVEFRGTNTQGYSALFGENGRLESGQLHVLNDDELLVTVSVSDIASTDIGTGQFRVRTTIPQGQALHDLMSALPAGDELVIAFTRAAINHELQLQFQGTADGSMQIGDPVALDYHDRVQEIYPSFDGTMQGALTAELAHTEVPEGIVLRPSFAGQMVGAFAPELRHTEVPESIPLAPYFAGTMQGALAVTMGFNEVPESIPLAPYFAGQMVGSFAPELRHTEVPESIPLAPYFAGRMVGSFEPELFARVIDSPLFRFVPNVFALREEEVSIPVPRVTFEEPGGRYEVTGLPPGMRFDAGAMEIRGRAVNAPRALYNVTITYLGPDE